MQKKNIGGNVNDYVIDYFRAKSVPNLLDGVFADFTGFAAQSINAATSSEASIILYTLEDPFGIGLKINKMISDI